MAISIKTSALQTGSIKIKFNSLSIIKILNYEIILNYDHNIATLNYEQIWENAKKVIDKKYSNMLTYCKQLATKLEIIKKDGIKKEEIDQKKLYKYNTKIKNTKTTNLLYLEINNKLILLIQKLNKIAIKYEIYLSNIIDNQRSQLELSSSNIDINNFNIPFTDEDNSNIIELQSIWFKMLGLCLFKHKQIKMNDYIENIKKERLGIIIAPTKDKFIKDAEQFAKLNLYGDIDI